MRSYTFWARLSASPPIHLAASVGEPVHAEGAIRLPAELTPGDYAAEFLIYDHPKDSKQPPTAQWVDFTIAGN
jgi:hypothetical protein